MNRPERKHRVNCLERKNRMFRPNQWTYMFFLGNG